MLLGNVTTETNTQATVEEMLEASFSMQYKSYQGKICDSFFSDLLVYFSPYQRQVLARSLYL
jgi:hypothetical protein